MCCIVRGSHFYSCCLTPSTFYKGLFFLLVCRLPPKKINLWRICCTVPSARSEHCLWKEQKSHQPWVHLTSQASSPSLPSAATPQGLLQKMIESNNVGNNWSGCTSNICLVIQMLMVIPWIILQTNILNCLFPGTSSQEWLGEAFPNMLATLSQVGSSATQLKLCLVPWPSCPHAQLPQGHGQDGAGSDGRAWHTGVMHRALCRLLDTPQGRTLWAAVPGAVLRCQSRAAVQSLMAARGMDTLQVLTVSAVHSYVLHWNQQHLVIQPLPMGKFPHSRVGSGSHNYHTSAPVRRLLAAAHIKKLLSAAQ